MTVDTITRVAQSHAPSVNIGITPHITEKKTDFHRSVHNMTCVIKTAFFGAVSTTAHALIHADVFTVIHQHLFNEQGLYDIYDIWHTPWWQQRKYHLILLGLMSACLVFLLAKITQWYIARKKNITLPPWEQAMRALLTIKPDATIPADAAQAKKCDTIFYVKMSTILKSYLHDRFGYPIKNSTDQETIAYLQAIDFNPEITGMVAEILNGGVYVKFAARKTIKENRERHFNMAIAIIQKTIPNSSQ